MKRGFDILVLNVLWLIFSIPLVTVGASTSAAFYVTLKIAGNEDYSLFKDFIKAFKMDFRQGTVLWAFTAPCIYAICLIWKTIGENGFEIFSGIGAIIFTAIVAVTFLYSYPLVARYENKLKKIVKNSIILSCQYIQKTLVLIAILAAEILIFYWLSKFLIFFLIFAPATMIYTVSIFAKKIFTTIEKKAVKKDE